MCCHVSAPRTITTLHPLLLWSSIFKLLSASQIWQHSDCSYISESRSFFPWILAFFHNYFLSAAFRAPPHLARTRKVEQNGTLDTCGRLRGENGEAQQIGGCGRGRGQSRLTRAAAPRPGSCLSRRMKPGPSKHERSGSTSRPLHPARLRRIR
jgi:hypothetical protein